MKIGIYGGTFNPPHMGHMASAQAALAVLHLDKLLFVPAALPPHKALPAQTAAAADRLAMARLMADGVGSAIGRPDDVTAADIELQRPGKSYTADTLAELRTRCPNDELWLLMGGDMFLTLQDWHDPQAIFNLAGIAAFARTEAERGGALSRQAAALRTNFGARVELIALPAITDVSSTALRQTLERGQGEEARKLLWPPVYGYILKKQLYGLNRDLKQLSDEDLRCVSYSMIRAKRIPHVRGTERTAVRLAERWGGNPDKARRAAILHDCTKYRTMEEQVALCAQYGVVLDELEQKAVKLLHAKTGAWLARDMFGADDEIFNAIYWHTTGRAGMTLLEKIIYLADYIEPTRDFPGVEDLRRTAAADLDAAVLMGFEMSIQEMRERDLPVHPNTAQARAWMLEKG